MTLTRRRFLTISAAFSAFPAHAGTRWKGTALGADASIHLRGPVRDTQPALEAVHDTIRRMERLFSLYDPHSAISRLNRDGRLHMPPEFSALMATVNTVHHATQGLFDPTVQPLWQALATNRNPANARASVGWQNVAISAPELRFERPRMALTLNGIAQGFATDKTRDVLAGFGFKDVIVNMGEYRVGRKVARIGVAGTNGHLVKTLDLTDEAVATSSPRALLLAGNHGHILDPSGADPARIWETVTVVAKTAALADGLSTALSLTPDAKLAKSLLAAGLATRAVLVDTRGTITEL